MVASASAKDTVDRPILKQRLWTNVKQKQLAKNMKTEHCTKACQKHVELTIAVLLPTSNGLGTPVYKEDPFQLPKQASPCANEQYSSKCRQVMELGDRRLNLTVDIC